MPGFRGVGVLKGGDVDTGSRPLDNALDEIVQPNAGFRFFTGLTELADALAHAWRIRGYLVPQLIAATTMSRER